MILIEHAIKNEPKLLYSIGRKLSKKERNNPMETNLTNELFTGTSRFKSPTFNIMNLITGSYMTAKGDGLEIKIEPLVDGDLSQIW